MIQYALDQDYNKSNEVFGEIMSIKTSDLLAREKDNIANEIFNDGQDDDESEDLDDDELDPDLEIDEEDLDISDIEDEEE